jgi:hypothetical protein
MFSDEGSVFDSFEEFNNICSSQNSFLSRALSLRLAMVHSPQVSQQAALAEFDELVNDCWVLELRYYGTLV